MRVLLIEDNIQLSSLLAERLETRGLQVDVANSIRAANNFVSVGFFDVIILDLGLPDGDGIDWLKALPEDRPPVLILSARSTLKDRVIGLDTGADDYLVKPAEIDEILARLHALLRRPGTRDPVILTVATIRLDPSQRMVSVGKKNLTLGKREFDFLEIMMRRVGRVVAKETLEGLLYSANQAVTPNAVEAIASRVRRRLSEANEDEVLHTVRGIGYYFGKRNKL